MFNVLNALNIRRRKNVPDRRLMKKKKAMKEVQIERVEHSSLKKRARTPSEEEEESDERNKKEKRSNKNKLANTTQKTVPQK